MIDTIEVDRLAILRAKQHQLFPRAKREVATMERHAKVVRPLRPDEEAAIVGEIPGAGDRYPARRRKRRRWAP